MRIIDRYMLGQFLHTFLICFLSLSGIFIVFDAFTKLEAFMHCAKGIQLLKLVAGYYAFQPLLFFDRTSGMLALMSAMFTVTWIQRHNEMTALMAAGISRIRIVAPVIIAAIVIDVLGVMNRELIIPHFRHEVSREPGELASDAGEELCPQSDNRTDVLLRGRFVYINQQRIEKPDFLLPVSLRDYGKHLLAANAYYKPPAAGRPGGYLLDGMVEPKNLAKQPSLRQDGKVVVITPRDAGDWLRPNQCFCVSDVPFEQLFGGQSFRNFASTAQLISSLRSNSLDFGAGIRVAIHCRIVQPVLDITLLFLGLPLVVTRSNRNVFMAIGLCLGVVTLFVLVVIGIEQLGSIELISPVLAAWLPLFIFVPAAVGVAEPMWER
jgi:lipopolysaccharide export system permease protein